MEALTNLVSKPLMKNIKPLAWKIDDLKEQVDRNNGLNSKIDAISADLHALAEKVADLKK